MSGVLSPPSKIHAREVIETMVYRGKPVAVSLFDPLDIRRFKNIAEASVFFGHAPKVGPFGLPSTNQKIPPTEHLVLQTRQVVTYFLNRPFRGRHGMVADSRDADNSICLPNTSVTRIIGIDARGYRNESPILARAMDAYAAAVGRHIHQRMRDLVDRKNRHPPFADALVRSLSSRFKNIYYVREETLASAETAGHGTMQGRLSRDALWGRAYGKIESVIAANAVTKNVHLTEGALLHVSRILAPDAGAGDKRNSVDELKHIAISVMKSDFGLAAATSNLVHGLGTHLAKHDAEGSAYALATAAQIKSALRETLPAISRKTAGGTGGRILTTDYRGIRAGVTGRTGVAVHIMPPCLGAQQPIRTQLAAARHQPH
ncbi:MAG: hypothetical protein AB7H77_03285 [Bdellovibrionales bacterium]